MIDSFTLENNLKEHKLDNCYVFCGSDEQNIKDIIKKIKSQVLDEQFSSLNYVELDGLKTTEDDILNACETLPFMSDRRMVLVYRAEFLKDKVDKSMESVFKEVSNYIKGFPNHCILIMYYVFQNDREKESLKVKKLDKIATVVKFSKLKGALLQKKVGEIFKSKNKIISRSDLAMFCNLVENDMNIIENEVEKLCSYVDEGDVTSKDIMKLVTAKSDNDIFNLVDFVSQRKPQMSLDILNELLFKGESPTSILRMIQRQFKLLFSIKLGVQKNKDKDVLSRELKLHPYICEKMINQSEKFSIIQLERIIEICLETERRLKTISVDIKTEMEMLIINTAII